MSVKNGTKIVLIVACLGGGALTWMNHSSMDQGERQSNDASSPRGALEQVAHSEDSASTSPSSHPEAEKAQVAASFENAQAMPEGTGVVAPRDEKKAEATALSESKPAPEASCKAFQFKVAGKYQNYSAEKMGQYRHKITSALSGLSSIDPTSACLNVGKRTVRHTLSRTKDGNWELTFGAVATAQSLVTLNVCRKNAKRETPCKLTKSLALTSLGLEDSDAESESGSKGFNSASGQDGMSAQIEREMTRELAGESDDLAFFEGWVEESK